MKKSGLYLGDYEVVILNNSKLSTQKKKFALYVEDIKHNSSNPKLAIAKVMLCWDLLDNLNSREYIINHLENTNDETVEHVLFNIDFCKKSYSFIESHLGDETIEFGHGYFCKNKITYFFNKKDITNNYQSAYNCVLREIPL